MESVTPLEKGEPAAAPAGRKVWKAGTLTYTSGGLVVLFFWLLWGDFAWSIKERSIGPVLQLLLKKFEISDMLSGLLIGTLPGTVAMLLGPVISYRSDRHRGRWGRRIPYLLIPTPIAVVSIAGLAFSPAIGRGLHSILGAHSMGLNSSVLLFFGLFWTLFEFATITANSVFGGLINDVVPHEMLGRFYALFRALSLIAGMIFNYWIVGTAETSYMWIFLGIGTLYGGGFSAMCLKVREGAYPPPPLPAGPNEDSGFFSAAKGYFEECFGHSYYLWFFATTAFSWTSFSPINLFSVYFAKSIDMDLDAYGKCLALTFLISLVLAYPLGILVDRFHPLRVSLVAQAFYAAVTLWGGLFAGDSTTFGIALVAHGVLSGAWMTAAASLGQRLLPQARYAQYASAGSLVSGLMGICVGPLMGLFLDLTHHAYRYTYMASSMLAVLALLTGIILHHQFMALGGPTLYAAPSACSGTLEANIPGHSKNSSKQ